MKTFPMFLQMAGRRVVIAGGGEQAEQKLRLLGRTEAQIVLVAPELTPDLAARVQAGAAIHLAGPVSPDTFRDTALVVIGSGCPGADAALHALAKQAGAVVNVVDQPWLCDAITPSIVDRDPVVVAIGTEGTAPVLGRQIKTRIETMLEPSLGSLAALVGQLRARIAHNLTPRARRDFYRWIFAGPVRQTSAQGDMSKASALIEDALTSGNWDRAQPQRAVVEATAEAADLIALRGVSRLQEADVIVFDVSLAGYLELARRDADRLPIGAEVPEGERIVWLVPTGTGQQLAGQLAAEWVPGIDGL